MDDALRMHKRNIKLWGSFWDNAKNSWYSIADLIALYNLTDQQLDVIGRRLMQWNPDEWWTMSVNDSPKMEALERFGSSLPF